MNMIDEIKIKKPIWKKWKFWLIAISIIIFIISTYDGENKEATPDQQSSQKQTQLKNTSQPSQVQQKKSRTPSDKAAITTIKNLLENYVLFEVDAKVADGRTNGGTKVLILSYKSVASTPTRIAEELGIILGSYIVAVRSNWDIDELSVVVGDMQGNAVGTWYCEKEWIDDFINGKITDEELSTKALTTITTI